MRHVNQSNFHEQIDVRSKNKRSTFSPKPRKKMSEDGIEDTLADVWARNNSLDQKWNFFRNFFVIYI